MATNADMKKNLETARSIDEKISVVAVKKQELTKALADRYTLMDKVHHLPRSLAIKNHPVHHMREQLQILFANSKECTDFDQLQKINEQIAAIQAQVAQIEEESTKTKKISWALRPPI